MRAILCRDTRGLNLNESERQNHFPVSPACSITWYFEGAAEFVALHAQGQAVSAPTPIGRITFGGPITRPTIVRNPGPIHAMVLLLLPDAVAQLTGIDPSAFLDRGVPVDEVFDPSWRQFCRAVDEAPDDTYRVALIEAFLLPRWQQARPEASCASHLIADWSQALALRAATSGLGRSIRQAERRIKQWTGQPLRELRGIGRSERAFFDAVVGVKAGEVNWSEVAANNGYTDQSHLCRQTRRITGFAPEELRRRVATEESFWAYRLWGYSKAAMDD